MSSPPGLEFRATTAMAIGSGGHCWNGNQQWLQLPKAILVVAFFLPLICIHKQTKNTGLATAGMKIGSGLWQNSGSELKLYLGCTGSTKYTVRKNLVAIW